MIARKFIFTFLLSCVSILALSQNINIDTTDWSKPENINPFDENILSSLNIKLADYVTQATMAEFQKDYKKAAQLYLFVIRNNNDDAESLYRLARCYSFMGRPSLSSNFLIKAINAGYSNIDKINTDVAFDQIRNTTIFKNTNKEISNYGKQFGETVYVEGKKMLKCRMQFPQNYNAEKEYTLIIGLHGNGGSTEGFIRLSTDLVGTDYIFAAPEGPYMRSTNMGNIPSQYSWAIQVQDVDLWKRCDQFSPKYILNVSNYISANYKIKSIYLLGFSQGAAYSYITGIKNQDVFKGIICIGGILPSSDKPYSLLSEEEINSPQGLKIFIAHSPQDKVLKFEHGKKAKKKLKKAGYDVTFQTYAGGHSVPPALLKVIVEWIKNAN